MCGIAGVLGTGASAGAMIAALTHRGPDGVRVEDLPGASLAHARLSIIDLEGGWQPLHAAGATVIGNGEIYNYVELAEEHQLAGQLATGSDFEPLLHLYAKEGPAAFARLRGMYALCLIGGDGRTWLARDPFGIKPLYLLELDGGLAFASEPRAFVTAGLLRPELDEARAAELLGFNYTLGEAAIFKGVRKLAPGEVVEVKDGRVAYSKRVPPLMGRDRSPKAIRVGRAAMSTEPGLHIPTPTAAPSAPPHKGEGELIAQLDAVLEDSVRVHQRSDVPYGLFLSGGIDSAAIATLMARLNERPVTAFTCGFDAPGAKDERAQAEKVATALNLDWRETSFGEADFWRILPEVAWALDDPTADYATLPTWKLAEAAKGTLSVVLTGEGGDELFGGYGRYRRALRPAWLGGRPAEPRPGDPAVLARWREAARAPKGLTRLQQAQWSDVATWLPNDLLLKLDRCLMAHGLEGRTPFLDPEVAAFAFPLADRFKVRGRYGKWLLRKWLGRTCPAAEPWARKQGFTVPVEAWIAPRAADIAPRLSRVEAVRRVRPDAEAIFAAGGEGQRWPLLFFAVWALIHLQGASRTEALEAIAGRP
ncbi:asparagine synthase (glutamine-hydrolyzing) [Phenylobacterium sp. J367]|uniref:asparagine synthase (glutamine-hydrolyzing) n=1 Tax=Phenylobacterium sp. J367 TaxID=2898435 RepID=UPI002150E30A|nr:asparagine synthase (glutamine-hydrolyzing) [Phenylobacterium sp. J367]MCR5877224.1 asparagine synthase (glutamine-hydrolyzing) [Phenylobacterium sp. J367]